MEGSTDWGVSVMDPKDLDSTIRYRIDGLGPGPWRCVWANRAEIVFTDPAGGIRALMSLDRLAEIGPGHLRYRA
jgi:hypothetical protein